MPAVKRDGGQIVFQRGAKGELVAIPNGFGNLFIEFTVTFPPNGFASDPAAFDMLRTILPPATPTLPPSNKVLKTVDTEEVDMSHQSRGRDASAMDVDDEDEEGGPGGERVQCASQ